MKHQLSRYFKRISKDYVETVNYIVDEIFNRAIAKGWSHRRLSQESNVSVSCIDRLGKQRTILPFFNTLYLLAGAVGYELVLTKGKIKLKNVS